MVARDSQRRMRRSNMQRAQRYADIVTVMALTSISEVWVSSKATAVECTSAACSGPRFEQAAVQPQQYSQQDNSVHTSRSVLHTSSAGHQLNADWTLTTTTTHYHSDTTTATPVHSTLHTPSPTTTTRRYFYLLIPHPQICRGHTSSERRVPNICSLCTSLLPQFGIVHWLLPR